MGIFRKVAGPLSLGIIDSKTPKQKQRLAEADRAKAEASLAREQAKAAKAERKSK